MYSTLWGAIRGANRSSARASTPYGPRSEIERLRALGRFARETPCRAYLPVRTACRTPAASCGALGALPPRLRRPLKGRCAGGQGASSCRPAKAGHHRRPSPIYPACGVAVAPWRVVFRKHLARPLTGSGALGFAPRRAFRTHSLKLGIASENSPAPPTRPRPGLWLRPHFSALRPPVTFGSWLASGAQKTAPPMDDQAVPGHRRAGPRPPPLGSAARGLQVSLLRLCGSNQVRICVLHKRLCGLNMILCGSILSLCVSKLSCLKMTENQSYIQSA